MSLDLDEIRRNAAMDVERVLHYDHSQRGDVRALAKALIQHYIPDGLKPWENWMVNPLAPLEYAHVFVVYLYCDMRVIDGWDLSDPDNDAEPRLGFGWQPLARPMYLQDAGEAGRTFQYVLPKHAEVVERYGLYEQVFHHVEHALLAVIRDLIISRMVQYQAPAAPAGKWLKWSVKIKTSARRPWHYTGVCLKLKWKDVDSGALATAETSESETSSATHRRPSCFRKVKRANMSFIH